MPRQTPRAPHRAPPSDVDLTLTTLGALGVAHHDARTPAAPRTLGPGKPTALLAYLACAPARTAARDALTALLWGDRETEPARHALRQTLWHLRRQLGADPFATADDTLTLAPHVRVDRDAFLAALDRDDPGAAVAAYGGEFCPAVALPGGLQFEHWADGERQRLRALFTAAAARAARRQLDLGRVRDAVTLARRVREAAPDAQEGWRLLLEALIAARDPLLGAEVAALERIAADDDVAIEPATRALLATARRIGDGRGRAAVDGAEEREDGSGAAGARLVAELVGREREFGALVHAWEDVRDRRAGRHVHVTAPAGMGKTRLLADFHARLRGARARTVAARAVLAERDAPFAFAAAVVRALVPLRGAAGVSPAAAAALVALTPVASTLFGAPPSTATGPEAERQCADAVGELLAAVAGEQPLVLLLDDWHWADDASARLLARVLARVEAMHVLAVTAARRTVGVAASDGFDAPIALPPLGPEALGALLASLGTLPEAPWALALPAALFDATGGSPLLALQSLRAALDRELLVLVDRAWSCAAPDALHALLAAGGPIDARLAVLAPDARTLLLLLATAGAALPLRVLEAATGGDTTPVHETLALLEQRGLAVREPCDDGRTDAGAADRCVSVTHDEIAAAAHDAADADARREAHARLALAWHAVTCAAPGPDPDALRRVAHHALRARDAVVGSGARPSDARLAHATASALERFLHARRAAGDRGSLREVARELAGQGADAATVTRLVRALPWRLRAGAHARRAVNVALFGVTVAALAVVGTLALRAPDAPDAELLFLRTVSADEGEGWLLSLRDDAWPDAPIELDDAAARAARRLHAGVAAFGTSAGSRVVLEPNGDWLTTRVYDTPSDVEVARWSRDGHSERLTHTRHDDGPEDLSPDGRTAVITTGRWDPQRASDLALLTLATGEVQPLTSGASRDFDARWSPDGTRIGFARDPFAQEGRRWEVCWVALDGVAPRCHAPTGIDVTSVLAWADRRHLLVAGYDRPAAGDPSAVTAERVLVLARVNVDDGGAEILDRGAQSYDASRDGQWVACVCEPAGFPGASPFVFPVRRPDAKRAIVRHGLRVEAPRQLVWRVPSPVDRSLREISIVAPSALPPGAPMRLHAVARAERGDQVPVDHVTWRVLTPDVASVDSSGVATGLREGDARFAASAGGWRADTVRVRVRPLVPAMQVDDPFPTAPGSGARWRGFGEPPPDVVTHRGRRAFILGGDGNFVNGAYSTHVFDARDGLILEAQVALPITAVHWQALNVVLRTLDTVAFRRWDGVSGAPPNEGAAMRACGWSFPDGEGAGRTGAMLAFAGSRLHRLAASDSLAAGAWHRVRLELRPDGRCRVTLDGGPSVLIESRLPLDRPFAVFVAGQSAGTQISVGRVRLWSGVRAPDAGR